MSDTAMHRSAAGSVAAVHMLFVILYLNKTELISWCEQGVDVLFKGILE